MQWMNSYLLLRNCEPLVEHLMVKNCISPPLVSLLKVCWAFFLCKEWEIHHCRCTSFQDFRIFPLLCISLKLIPVPNDYPDDRMAYITRSALWCGKLAFWAYCWDSEDGWIWPGKNIDAPTPIQTWSFLRLLYEQWGLWTPLFLWCWCGETRSQ